MFTKEECTLEWILGSQGCDFCDALELFLPFSYFCQEHMLEMKVEIT